MDAVAARVFDYEHPMLAQLRADPSREPEFWSRIGECRTPLIAPAPNSDRHSIVSYVFPAPEGAKHVVVHPGYGFGRDNVMSRIPGTAACHASYAYRNDTRTSYSFAPDWPLVSWTDCTEAEFSVLRAFRRDFPLQPDPNHRQFTVGRGGDGQPDMVTSFVALSEAPDESAIHKRPGISRGKIERHIFKSQTLGNARNIWVYTPPGYELRGDSYPVLVVFDGGATLSLIPTHRILDNLLADGQIRPAIALFIDNPTDTSRNVELPCNRDFARFIELELLPWFHRAHPSASPDPRDNYLAGSSYGGLASLWLGLRLPHLFGNVISQAGSLWWGPGFDLDRPLLSQRYRPEWLIKQYAASPRVPLRIWLEVGLMDDADRMIEPNRRMKGLLEEKGYDVIYSEPCGGHDYVLWRGTFAAALKEMLPA